ncbi:hypothetical protein AALA80_10855 [Oscillospiraceae bacterium 50-60]
MIDRMYFTPSAAILQKIFSNGAASSGRVEHFAIYQTSPGVHTHTDTKKTAGRRSFLLCVFRREKTHRAGKTLCLILKIPQKHDKIVLFL